MQRLWGRKVSDLAFAEFIKITEWVAYRKGKIVQFIDRWFPSSKLCGGCGCINDDLRLEDRTWRCKCGQLNDRDGNAAKNIERAGIAALNLERRKTCPRSGSPRLKLESHATLGVGAVNGALSQSHFIRAIAVFLTFDDQESRKSSETLTKKEELRQK